MMRWIIFSVAVVAVAAIATVGATYLAPDDSSAPVPAVQEKEKPTGPTGLAVVEGGLAPFNFGIMPQATEGKHEWTIVNKGAGPLKLSTDPGTGGTTCSCTNGSIPRGGSVELKPGETFTMVVTWNTKTWTHFHQTATVLVSNDPEHQKLDFVIEGEAHPPIVTAPAESRLDFQTVTSDSAVPHYIALASFDRPDTKVLSIKVNPELFRTEVQPMTAEECKGMKVEKGNKIVVTANPGAPLGPFQEELVIETDHPKKPEVKFVLFGKVEGPIRFSPERVRLFVPAKTGGKETLTLWVRGQKETKFTVEKKPENLDIQIAPMAAAGEAKQYSFTVTIPPGQPAGTHYDDTIILKTDHPNAAEVKIPVAVTFLRAG